MIRLLISNQRGGVGKTTTAITLARYLVDEGRRVLLIDTDPQGSVESVLGLKATHHLAHFVAHRYALSECTVRISDRFEVLCSNRETLQAEAALMGAQAREVVLQHLLERVEKDYDAILIDSAPSISILQTCAMFYARNVLIPVDMDSLSVTGAGATITAVNQLNEFLKGDVRVIGFLPTQVDRRLQMTQAVLQSLDIFRDRYHIPVLPEIRVDSSVPKSLRARKTLADYDPTCRAVQDYRLAFAQIIQLIEGGVKSAEAQPKPEPITPEEVMDSPALKGFDTFLRHRVAERPEPEPGKGEAGLTFQSAPIWISPTGVSQGGVGPSAERPPGQSPTADIDIGIFEGIAEVRPGPKIRRAVKAQDGHSTGEQLVYQALWNAASVETPDTRLIRIGYGGLQSLCGLDKTNCKDNIQSLIRKLALEVVSPFSVKRNQGSVYRVFSANSVLKRRRAAGMEWVIRNKGVRFVSQPPIGE